MKVNLFIIFLLAAAALAGCNKANQDQPLAQPRPATLNVLNGTTDTLNFYLNGTRQNNTSSLYAGGATGYLSVVSGTQNFQFRKAGHSEVLFSLPLNLDSISHSTDTLVNHNIRGYSLFVGGETADKVFYQKDTLHSDAYHARVRFANPAAGAGALDVFVGDTLNFKNVNFKTITGFKPTIQGLKTIYVRRAGQADNQATQKYTFASGSSYTLYVKGVPGGTGNSALTVSIFVNQ